ncbi:TetR/AcrR family transcriptional regulator [Streptomyces sp. GbtcB6]|uniref:TetR/AcrR family transcriptional regulator n=1 Tax=Streptomyces sp. GbtcB6 TaxID=2824751 RepID=UPI001C310065|nr:TetR/AcrR family transcriptional regulator [Streptomyces sp. GbtcB6]
MSGARAGDGKAADASGTGGRRRLARDTLSRRVILDAAEKVASRDGLEAFTFQALAKELHAHPTSLYRHFRDKDELILELIDDLRARSYGGQLKATDSWRDDLRTQARYIHEHYLRYPVFAWQMAARTTRRPTEFANVEFALDCLYRAGLDDEEAVAFVRVFGNVIRSLSAMEAGLQALDPDSRDRDTLAWELEYRRLPADTYPRIAGLTAPLAAIGDPRIFDNAIDMLLDSVAARVRDRATEA